MKNLREAESGGEDMVRGDQPTNAALDVDVGPRVVVHQRGDRRELLRGGWVAADDSVLW